MLRLLNSAGVRLAVGYATVFGVSALLLILALQVSTVNLLNNQVDAAIKADLLGLSEQLEDGGPKALFLTIKNRVQGNVDDDAVYLVRDQQGRQLAGNLDVWPPEVVPGGPTVEVSLQRDGHRSLARLDGYQLSNGWTLLVGRDVESRRALRALMAQTLGWALLLIAVLSVVGAAMVRQLFNRMLSHVSETAAAISGGDLSRRVRLSGRGDEFDQLATTINDMLDRISRLMDGVREVSNAIAHDLRTPITRARARLEDAVGHASSAADLRVAIERAVTDLDAITAVFQALLRISEIEAGARRSAFVEMDAQPLLDDLAELYEAVAEEKGVRLELDADAGLKLRGDRDLLQQAVANLLDNAIKFSPTGGTIRLRGGRSADTVRITVIDQGPGIPPDDLGRATERFYRGETARSTPGFGLGLTLVRAVAQLHGGTLLLQDAAPGLRAVLSVPALAETWTRLTPPAEMSPPSRPGAPAERDRAAAPASLHGTRDDHPPAPSRASPVA